MRNLSASLSHARGETDTGKIERKTHPPHPFRTLLSNPQYPLTPHRPIPQYLPRDHIDAHDVRCEGVWVLV